MVQMRGPVMRRRNLISVVIAVCCAVRLVSAVSAEDGLQPDDIVRQYIRFPGIRRFKPGAWGTAGIELINPRDEPAEVVTGLYFDGDPLSRFSRRVWIPARSRRATWFPVRPAETIVDIQSRPFLYEAADDARSLLRKDKEYFLEANLLPLVESPMTAIVGNWDAADVKGVMIWRETAIAMRLISDLSTRITRLNADDIPPFHPGLDAVDHLIIVGDEIAESPSGLDTTRAFLQRGGHLWVPLDQVSLRTVNLLFGDALRIAEVDRIGLTEVGIQNVLTNQPSGSVREFDDPVNLVRLLVSDVVVSHEVNGWPAAFWIDVGQGRAMFTALSARGWMRPRRPDDILHSQLQNSHYVAEPALTEITDSFTRELHPPPLTSEDFESFLREQVGYRILARRSVLAILGLYCMALMGLGTVFQRSAQLNRLIWAGPLVALIATVPLVVFGERPRRAIPPTLAVAEVVRVEPDATTTQTTGLAAIFVPESSTPTIEVRRNALVIPRRDRVDGTIREMVWTDMDEWYWDNMKLSPGLHFGSSEQHATLAQEIRATGTFDRNGLRGFLETGMYDAPADALIATRTQHTIAPRLEPDGHFSAGSGDVLPPGIGVSGVLLSDDQRRRSAIYQQMLRPRSESRYPNRPMFLVWTRPVTTNLTFSEEMQQTHSSLLAIPLDIRPPAPGTQVFIPSPFLHFETVGDAPSMFNNRTRQWNTTSASTDALLRFQVPLALVPMELEHARLYMSIQAPGRTFLLSTGVPGQLVPQNPVDNAVGHFEYETEQPDALRLDAEGGLHVRLQVEDHLKDTESQDSLQIHRSWKLEYIRLELTGRTAKLSD